MSDKHKIAIVNSSTFGQKVPGQLDQLRKFADVEFLEKLVQSEIISRLNHVDLIIAGISPFYDRKVLSGLGRLKGIVRHGVGIDNIDLEAASELGVVVTRIPGSLERDAVAEHSIGLLLSLVRHIPFGDQMVREGGWARRTELIGHSICEMTIGVIGCGEIGSRVVEILHSGFRAKVIVSDPRKDAGAIRAIGGEKVTLEELLGRSDAVMIHCPLTPETRGMINNERLKGAKKGILLINAARAEIINESDLGEALQTKHVGAFASDVFYSEPPQLSHPIFGLSNVIIVPHLGAYTIECLQHMGEQVISDARTILVDRKIPGGAVTNSNSPYRILQG